LASADADAPDSDVRDEADDPDPSAPEPGAPEPAAPVAPGTPATIALTPTRAGVVGLAVLSLVSVVLSQGWSRCSPTDDRRLMVVPLSSRRGAGRVVHFH
jgi:hypothetical protein